MRVVEKYPDERYLGTREITGSKVVINPRTKKEEKVSTFGEYKWKTYKEVYDDVLALANSIVSQELSTTIEEGEEKHNLIGIFGKNSREWVTTDLACAMSNRASVTLYDTLGPEASVYIINQCELKTIFMTRDKIKEMLELSKSGKIPSLKNLIIMDKHTEEDAKMCEENDISIKNLETLIEEGRDIDIKLPSPYRDSIFTICYTSGTTGDPKGVMLSHINLICPGAGLDKVNISLFKEDIHISYLPLAHVFERVVVVTLTGRGAKIGFYQGDVLKLKEDLAELRPTIFCSVPRLFNKFYDGMMAKVNDLTGMKKKLASFAIGRKLSKLEKSGDPTHMVYDRLVFNKFKDAIGGNVRFMITGSAPISKDVINFLKIAFCCPFYEGYGQTETAGGS